MNLLPMSIMTRSAAPAPGGARARRGTRGAAPAPTATVPAPVPTPVVAPAAAPAAKPADEPDTPTPCGWFDSSHELRCGLVVTELEQPEAVARVVPLSWWLQWQLQG
jgi:hypothetical protein